MKTLLSKTIEIALSLAVFAAFAMTYAPTPSWAQVPSEQADSTTASQKTEVVLATEIKWQALNPARGERGPKAGTIWGDQTKDEASGFLVKFVDGFSSPPHIHNITYRGIVLGGALHNDDPEAKPMWMPTGSYWTQPAGEVHITSARGSSIAYVEIQSGPYLVKPADESFDRGEKPINVDRTNIIWLGASDTTWIDAASDAPTDPAAEAKMTFLWGDPSGEDINGTMVKLPAGFAGSLNSESSTLKVIVVKGEAKLHETGDTLTAGSYFGSSERASHQISCEQECVIYIRTKGRYKISPSKKLNQ